MSKDEERAANLEKYGRYSTKADSEEMKAVYMRAIAAVRAEEREACAKLAKGFWMTYPFAHIADADVVCELCESLSAAIRARK